MAAVANNLGITVTVDGVDQASKQLRELENATKRVGSTTGQASAQLNKLQTPLKNVAANTNAVSGASKSLTGNYSKLAGIISNASNLIGRTSTNFKGLTTGMNIAAGGARLLGGALGAAGPLGIAIAGLSIALPALIDLFSDTTEEMEGSIKTARTLADEIGTVISKIEELEQKERLQSGAGSFAEHAGKAKILERQIQQYQSEIRRIEAMSLSDFTDPDVQRDLRQLRHGLASTRQELERQRQFARERQMATSDPNETLTQQEIREATDDERAAADRKRAAEDAADEAKRRARELANQRQRELDEAQRERDRMESEAVSDASAALRTFTEDLERASEETKKFEDNAIADASNSVGLHLRDRLEIERTNEEREDRNRERGSDTEELQGIISEGDIEKSIEAMDRYRDKWGSLSDEIADTSLASIQVLTGLDNFVSGQLTSTLHKHVEAWVSGSEDIGEALQGLAKDAILSLATQAIVEALAQTAQGIAAAASYRYDAASEHFAAAAAWGAVGAAAGAASAALHSGGGGSKGGSARSDAVFSRPDSEQRSTGDNITYNFYGGGPYVSEVQISRAIERSQERGRRRAA